MCWTRAKSYFCCVVVVVCVPRYRIKKELFEDNPHFFLISCRRDLLCSILCLYIGDTKETWFVEVTRCSRGLGRTKGSGWWDGDGIHAASLPLQVSSLTRQKKGDIDTKFSTGAEQRFTSFLL